MTTLPRDIGVILAPGEQVQLYIKQKIYHPKINIDAVTLTNERIILIHPKDFALRKDYTDYSYSDIANAILDKGFLRSTIRCVLRFGGEPLILGKLPNGAAEKAYGIIRSNITQFQGPYPLQIPNYSMAMPSYLSQNSQPVLSTGSQSATTSQLPQTPFHCPKCNAPTVPGAKYCASCGTMLTAQSSTPAS